MRIITDIQRKLSISLFGLIQATTTGPIPPALVKVMKSPGGGSCGAKSVAENSTLLGVPVLKVETNDSHGHLFGWRAPTLDCIYMKKVHYIKTPAGQEVLVTTYDVTNVQLGEPDASLFSVPAGTRKCRLAK